MNMQSGFRIALKALARNKLQSALTMTGMTIGVATVLTMIAMGSGAQAAIEDQVRAAGMNLVFVTAGNYKIKTEDDGQAIEENARLEQPAEIISAVWHPDRRARLFRVHAEDDPMEKHDHPTAAQRLGDSEAGLGAAATLLPTDADAIRQMRGVQYVSEGVHENAHVVFGDKRWFTRLHGDDVSLARIRRGWTFQRGSFYSRGEEKRADQVIVLGTVVAEKLFGAANPIGQSVKIWNQGFQVIGVVGSSTWITSPTAGDDQFDAVYVPFTTVHRLLNLSKLNDITISAASAGDVSRIAKSVTDLLRRRHNITANKPDDFTVTTQARQALARGGMRADVARSVVGNVAGLEKVTLEQLGKTLDRASRTMTVLLACIAAVSLLVGGIGIMNIMLLAVTERTAEIGLRRAVGARTNDVLLQFLLEATTLSISGGLAGIVIGVASSMMISQWAGWSATVSGWSVAISFGIAAAVGIFFGYYPARQAAGVSPLQSLRYE